MVYTLTLNPSIDYYLYIDSLRQSFVNRSRKEEIYPGGKGINVSIMLNNLGIKNTALGFYAGDTGEILIGLLDELSIDSSFIPLKNGRTRINVKIKAEAETEINAKGPKITKDDMDKLFQILKTLGDGDFLVLSGFVGPSLDNDTYNDIMELVKNKNVKVVLDTTGDFLTNALHLKPFLIKPNIHELEEIFSTRLSSIEEIVSKAKELQRMGAQNVLVSMGGDGAVLVNEHGEVISGRAPVGRVINTTGAGDSAVAGFIASYIEHSDYQKAFLMAISAGSATAFSEGLASGEDVMKIYENVGFKDADYI